jgi:uncharacterized damage-inducible protein DinB
MNRPSLEVERAQREGATPDFLEDFLWQLAFVEQRLTELAHVIPQEKYSWRPTPETRSISQVLLHIAAGNLLAANSLGSPLPAGFDVMSYEKRTTKKAEVIETARASFAQLRTAATAVPLNRKVDLFGHEATAQRVLLTVTMHQHEHLGQTITCARSVGVTPPWTASEQASERAHQKGN